MQVAQGRLDAALESFQASLAIRERLAEADPNNAGWQRDLSVSWNKLGGLRKGQGDLAGALEAYEQDLAIARNLGKADPGNASWQRDLAISWEGVGDVRLSRGEHAEAADAYAQSLAIRQKLAAIDAGNARWKSELSMARWRLAAAVVMQGGSSRGPEQLEAALSAMKTLDEEGRLLPTDEGYVEELRRRISAQASAAKL